MDFYRVIDTQIKSVVAEDVARKRFPVDRAADIVTAIEQHLPVEKDVDKSRAYQVIVSELKMAITAQNNNQRDGTIDDNAQKRVAADDIPSLCASFQLISNRVVQGIKPYIFDPYQNTTYLNASPVIPKEVQKV